jgi:hypothetical protein
MAFSLVLPIAGQNIALYFEVYFANFGVFQNFY